MNTISPETTVIGLREKGGAYNSIAVVGYDDSDASRVCIPPLTTVSVPYYEMGRVAAKRLLEQVISEENYRFFHEKLSVHLVVRESCERGVKY